MRRLSGVVGLVLLVSGCGGGGTASGDLVPKEDPGAAMVRLVRHEFAGRLDRSYAMLVEEQQKAVNRDLYVRCPPGAPTTNVNVVVVGVQDVIYDVPVLGKIRTKAVSFKMSITGADGKPISVPHTGHLIAQKGQWHWTLSRQSFSALLAGACP